MTSFNEKVKEILLYSFSISGLPENEQKICYLVDRYRGKVSQRLLDLRERLIKKGREIGPNWSYLIYKENPLLSLIKKNKEFHKVYPLPMLTYIKEEEIKELPKEKR